MPARAFGCRRATPCPPLTVGSIGTARGEVSGDSAHRESSAPGRCLAGSGRARQTGRAPAPVPRDAAGTAPPRCGATSPRRADVLDEAGRARSRRAPPSGDGIAPRPVVIFHRRQPSVCPCTFAEVQSAGFGFRAAAPGPSPFLNRRGRRCTPVDGRLCAGRDRGVASSPRGSSSLGSPRRAGPPRPCAQGRSGDGTTAREQDGDCHQVPPRIRRRAMKASSVRADRGR